jgi:hypothetical protein
MAEKKDKYRSSFGIIRANPRISGNLKISIDSTENIWLNSIDSNDEMSKNQYKGYRISSEGDFAQDVYSFFNNGKTPTNFIFGIKGEETVKENFVSSLVDQYDGFYHAGVTPLVSSVYTESFSYLAPIWLGKDIPKYFIIFRIDDPIDFSYIIKVTSLEVGKNYKVLEDYGLDTTSSTYQAYKIKTNGVEYSAGSIFSATSTSFTTVSGSGNVVLLDSNYNVQYVGDIQEHFINNILPKSSIVSTFSLQKDSKIGKYIRNIQNNSGYSQSLIDVRFEKNSLSTYNGVSVLDGVYCKKGEYLDSLFSSDSTITEFDQVITDGFKRNDVISYNLLNLEFLFDDNDADLYTINRYYGLYVDDLPTGKFQLSGDLFYNKSVEKGNFPEPKSSLQVSKKMLNPFHQQNKDGLRLFIDNDSKWGDIPSSDNIHIGDRLKYFYVKDKNNKFYSYKQSKGYTTASSLEKWGDNTDQNDLIILKNRMLDISSFAGIDSSKTKEYKGILAKTGGRSYSVIKIGGELLPNDAIVLYHPFGQNKIGNKRYDYFVASELTYVVSGWGPGSYMDDGAYYFHPFGTNEEIARAIAGAINSVNYKSYKAFNIGDEVVIRSEGSDHRNDDIFSLFVYKDFYAKQKFDIREKIFINGIDGADLTNYLNFIGGSEHTNTRVKIKAEDANKLSTNTSYIRTNFGLSKVRFIGKFIDETESELSYHTIKDYTSHAIVEIEDNTHSILLGTGNTIIVEELVEIETGIFSMYPIKDLDIDFWSSTYGRTPTQEYYRYIDIQPDGISTIYPEIDYAVAAGSSIEYNGSTYGPNSNFIFRGVTGSTSYKLLTSGDNARFNVVPTMYVNAPLNISGGNNDPHVDLDKFPGFLGLQEIKFLDDTSLIYTKKDQMNFGKVSNEYDVLKENYLRNLVTLSRITPYITKWVYNGGIDVRGNEYRLNSSPAFTPLNFSPSFFGQTRDPLYFSNEWYLLENPPIDAPADLLKNSSSYCVGGTGGISISSIQSADPSLEDYFVNYFTVDGEDYYALDNVKFSDVKNRGVDQLYTYFTYDPASGFSDTLFRGVKVRIKERTDASLETKEKNLYKLNDSKFEGYKFSCVLKSVDDSDPYKPTAPLTFKVHQNDQFKTVTLIITIVNNDLRFVDPVKFRSIAYNATGDANKSFETATGSWFYNPTGIYGGVDYFGLYSVSNKYRHSVSLGSSGTEYERLNNGGYLSSTIGNVKLSAGLNVTRKATIGFSSLVDETTTLGSGIVAIAVNPSYDTDLREEVKFYDPTTPVVGTGSRPSTFKSPYTLFSPRADVNGGYWFRTPWITGSGKNYVNFNEVNYTNGVGYFFDFTSLGYPYANGYTKVPISASYNAIKDRAVYQFAAGENYWDALLNKITFPEIYRIFTEDSSYINYTRSTWDATNQTSIIDNNTFVLEFIKPSSFIQEARKIPIEEDYKPESYSNTNVGYKLVEENAITEFFRYGGGYIPKFKDILLFDNVKKDRLSTDKNPDTSENPDVLDVIVTVQSKTLTSKYYGVGSAYEILINGATRKKLRLVKGNSYNFIFDNFSTLSSSGSGLKKNFVFSYVEDSGETVNLYNDGFSYTSDTTALFVVPQDAPDQLYYEIENENFAGGSALVAESLEYKNATLGVYKDSFGKIKNLNLYKYAKSNPFGIDPQSGFKPQYPLIGETPIDKRDMFIFESTWDAGRYREYYAPTTYQYVPGVKNMVEQKSFFGSKVMQTPNVIKEPMQLKYPSSLTDVFNINSDLYPKYEILWEETDTEIKALLLVDRTAIKHFQEGGIDKKFAELLVSEFGVGNETILTDDADEYVKTNVLPQYEAKEILVFVKKIKIIQGVNLEPIITDLSDYQKISTGFVKSANNDIKKRSPLQYEYKLQKDPSFDYSVAFSFVVGKI